MIAIVTCHFNFAGYTRPVENLHRFLRQNPETYGTELFLPGTTPVTSDYPRWVQIEADLTKHVLFQKEALLNLAVNRLPASYNKIAIIDADIEFADPMWLNRASRALDDVPIIQPYSRAFWMDSRGLPSLQKPSGLSDPDGLSRGFRSHPGFAWCLRRSLWNQTWGTAEITAGLYPYCFLGSGDTALAYALLGLPADPNNWPHQASREHYERWAKRFGWWAKGKFGHVDGDVFHMFHGTYANRRYAARQAMRAPVHVRTMLEIDAQGLLAWTDEATEEIKQSIRTYFTDRAEDEDADHEELSFELMVKAAKELLQGRPYMVTSQKITAHDNGYSPSRDAIRLAVRYQHLRSIDPPIADSVIAEAKADLDAKIAAEQSMVEPPKSRQLDPYDFTQLFTDDELVAIQTSVDPIVIKGRTKVQTIKTFVDLDDPETQQLLNYFEYGANVIGSGRAAEILA